MPVIDSIGVDSNDGADGIGSDYQVHYHPHSSLVDNINAFLHGSILFNGSHSHTGRDNGTASSAGQVEDVLIVVCALLIPLVLTTLIILLIAIAVRKMRRAESMQEVASSTNEFKLSNKTKQIVDAKFSDPRGYLQSQYTSQFNGMKPSGQFNPNGLSNSSSFTSNSQLTPWYVHSTAYHRSQYNLNKIQRQQSYNGSLQSSHSAQSLTYNSSLDGSSLGTNNDTVISLPQLEDEDSSKKKKSKSPAKKIKKVLQEMNFPKKIRQHQAEKNRFNVYTIPMETREQLKQIYVY